MKSQFVIGLVIVAVFASAQAQDLSILLTNPRLVQKEINCILQRGPCDAIGNQIKGLLPEALNNQCHRCNPQQAVNSRKLIYFMRTNFPNEWQEIVRLYGTNVNYIS